MGATYTAAGSTDEFVNDGKTFVQYKNTNAASRTITVTSQRTCDQGGTHNLSINLPATTGDVMIGPFTQSRFNDSAGKVQLAVSATTNVTVAVFSL